MVRLLDGEVGAVQITAGLSLGMLWPDSILELRRGYGDEGGVDGRLLLLPGRRAVPESKTSISRYGS